jgi:hypothetical protein
MEMTRDGERSTVQRQARLSDDWFAQRGRRVRKGEGTKTGRDKESRVAKAKSGVEARVPSPESGVSKSIKDVTKYDRPSLFSSVTRTERKLSGSPCFESISEGLGQSQTHNKEEKRTERTSIRDVHFTEAYLRGEGSRRTL